MYRFEGKSYEIHNATCGAGLGDPYWSDTYNGGRRTRLGWWFEMQVDDPDPDERAPRVVFDGIFIECQSWVEIVGKHITWTSAINEKHDSRYGWTDTFECSLIVRGSFQITSRHGLLLRVEAHGSDEWQNEFEIAADYAFQGIVVNGSERDSNETFRARLLEHISLEYLEQQPATSGGRYDSGVEMKGCLFLPKL